MIKVSSNTVYSVNWDLIPSKYKGMVANRSSPQSILPFGVFPFVERPVFDEQAQVWRSTNSEAILHPVLFCTLDELQKLFNKRTSNMADYILERPANG